MKGHYYLRSSLPEFDPLAGDHKIHYDDLYLFILENISAAERTEIKYLVFRNDVRNFLSFKARKSGFDQFALPFLKPSIFEEEYWENPVISFEVLPDFMEDFLENREIRAESDFNIFQSRIWTSYYESAIIRANKYLKRVLNLELYLFSTIHDYLTKRKGFPDQRIEASFFNEIPEPDQIYLSFLRELHSESQNMIQLEKQADSAIIEAANNIIPINRYQFNSITAYFYRLLIGSKWSLLSAEEGLKRKSKMVMKMADAYELPA
jgi:hypothetical protein